jgi:hypothetical protein
MIQAPTITLIEPFPFSTPDHDLENELLVWPWAVLHKIVFKMMYDT